MTMNLVCPVCRGSLEHVDEGAACRACPAQYPKVGPILDLRVPGAAWIDYEEDLERARRLLRMGPDTPAAELIQAVFASRESWTAERIADREQRVLADSERFERELDGWLRPCLSGGGPVLDLGCGPGQLVAALVRAGHEAVGVDVAIEWLVVADRVARESGGAPLLVAALAEALPFEDESLAAVLSMDTIEHVGDQPSYLREIGRVLRPGGCVALTTPNRFSIAAEPHVRVWGVGWLPRAWQRRYAESRSGSSYAFVRLLSSFELRRMVTRHAGLRTQVRIPPIPPEDMRRFDRRRATLARIYNVLAASRLTRWLFLAVGPFFRVVGRKDGSTSDGA